MTARWYAKRAYDPATKERTPLCEEWNSDEVTRSAAVAFARAGGDGREAVARRFVADGKEVRRTR